MTIIVQVQLLIEDRKVNYDIKSNRSIHRDRAKLQYSQF